MHLSWTHVVILAAFLHLHISVQITVLIKSIIWYLSHSTITVTDYIMTSSYSIFVCFAFTPSTHQVVVIIVYPILLSKCPETDIFLWNLMCQTHRIHGTGIFTYMKTHTNQRNSWIGKYTYNRPMGIRHGKVKGLTPQHILNKLSKILSTRPHETWSDSTSQTKRLYGWGWYPVFFCQKYNEI